MSTDTTVKQLMINKLTEAQYDTAVQGGVIGPNELSFVTDMDIEVIQVDTMPTADASEAGNIYQYTGATDANYTHGYFYECVGAGSPVVYSWVQTNTQPGQVNSDWNAVSGVSQILNKPSLATVATTGDYSDLTNKPTIPAAQVNSDWNANSGVAEILNKPTLATVATSGLYSDLSGTPTIPTVPCILLDYEVTASTGVITIETNSTPTTKTVKEVIGGASIAGSWTTVDTTHFTFTPTTANDILDNANGFMIKVA